RCERHLWTSSGVIWGSVAKNILRREEIFGDRCYAATPNKLSANLAWPIASLLSNLLTCPFLIMFTASMPSRVRSAVWKLLKHCDALTFFLTKRWSCSITLLRYLTRRSLQSFGST